MEGEETEREYRERETFKRSSKVENILGDGDNFGANAIAGKQGDIIAPGRGCPGRALDSERRRR